MVLVLKGLVILAEWRVADETYRVMLVAWVECPGELEMGKQVVKILREIGNRWKPNRASLDIEVNIEFFKYCL